MAHNYIIQFKSLRSATVYTLAIGGGTGDAIPLTPGAQPFTTQEDDNEDVFTPVRTQSGYLRVVDDGKDANGNAWDWKDLIPATDTSRPVTLTHMIPNPDAGQEGEPDEIEVTDWVGFMQAQTFSGVLYGNPQEREFPVQCPISAMQGQYISTSQTELKNFAYLLKAALESVPSSGRPTNIAVQGGAVAQTLLLIRLDWQNLISENDDGQATARYDYYTCMEDMCNYWGWTAHTYRDWLILEMADDSDSDTWLTLTTEQLATIAGGKAAGTTDAEWEVKTLSGDIYASTQLNDIQLRGYSKALVTAQTGNDGEGLIEYATDRMVDEMEKKDYGTPIQDGDKSVAYTEDILSFSYAFQSLSAASTYGSFNIASMSGQRIGNTNKVPMMRIKKTYAQAQSAAISMATAYSHCYFGGSFKITGDVYRLATKFESQDDMDKDLGIGIGNKTMVCSFGVGNTRQTCKWFNGSDWQNESCKFTMSVGNTDGTFYVIQQISGVKWRYGVINPPLTGLVGRIFFDIYGSSDVPERDNQRSFEIADFNISYSLSDLTFNSQYWYTDRRKSERTYKATNGNANDDEYSVDNIYGSQNQMTYGFGLLINTNNVYMGKLTYGALSLYPEQHMANRVAHYWETSRRQLRLDLRTDAAGEINPRQHLVVDSSEMYPVAISRQWRDDMISVTAIEVDPLPEPEE